MTSVSHVSDGVTVMRDAPACQRGLKSGEFRMQIVNTLKFAIGIVALLVAIVMVVRSRKTRGFNQTRQMAAMLLVTGAAFVAIGFGFDFKSLF